MQHSYVRLLEVTLPVMPAPSYKQLRPENMLNTYSEGRGSGALCTASVVAHIAELALALKVAAAESLPGFRPVRAAASREHALNLLALLGAILEHASGAHLRLAHHDIEAGLFLTILGKGARCKKGKYEQHLHC